MFERFHKWLNHRRPFLSSWYTKDSEETQEPERSLVELPEDLKDRLVEAVENLPSNPADKEAIASKLDEAFGCWRKDTKNADNSIVFLSSPITAVSRILSDTLEEWTKQQDVSFDLFPLNARPFAIDSIKSKLKQHLDREFPENEESKQLEIILIPNLSWCFLRSLEGLEGIEYLQSLLCDSAENRFWIIGGGEVGWEYLNSVCAIEAYCGEVFTLPKISSEDTQSWFEPIIDRLEIVFDDPRLKKKILDGDKDNKTAYFERLTNISQGVSTIMVQIFLKSICYRQPDKDDEGDKTKAKSLVARTPELNKLPDLKSDERYLLYSLLLHGDMTISALAESLGDDKAEVQAGIQMLRRQGIVEQKEQILKINPIYYPQLKRELASNNFIVDRR